MSTRRAIPRRTVAATLSVFSVITLITVLIMSAMHPTPSKAADLSNTYNWKQLKIGGGGFVTGIAIHPTTPNLVYVRTDVGGAYRWDAASSTWTQLLTANAVPNPDTGDYNVESIAVSKSNDQVVYVAVGTTYDINNGTPTGRILKSTNRGASWSDSGQRWPMNGNAEYRQGGERLAIDPNNENVVYFGSRTQGLWVSTDGAAHWHQVSTSQVPVGSNGSANNPVGVKFVLFDPNSGTTNGQTNRIYAGVAGQGIYTSTNGGANWSNSLSRTDIPFSDALGPDGTFYTVIIGGSTSVQKYVPGTNTWTEISPSGNSSEIAVDPFNPQRLFVASGGVSNGNIWRSIDGGAHWDSLNISVSSPDNSWIVSTDESGYMSSAQILFDTQTPNKLWFPQGTGVWVATNLSDPTINWVFTSNGIEETVTTDVIAPPGGKPVTAIDDRNGFYHADPDSYPQKTILTPKFSAGLSLNYSGGTPGFVAAVSTDTRGINPDQSGYSTNGGQTWTQFSGSRNYSDLYGGNIAISATDTSNIVWLPTGNKKPYYTNDTGATWTQGTSGLDNALDIHRLIWWGSKRALDADKVKGGTFYLYCVAGGNGLFYRSTDGGKTWTQGISHAPTSAGNDAHVFGQVHAAPGHANNVWVSTAQGGLSYTTDAGDSWTKISAVQYASAFGFGKPVGGQSYPAVYIYGEVNNQYGIWRSIDQGVSWDLASQYPLGIYDKVNAVSGDMNIAGRVYVGFGGNGFAYGDSSAIGTIGTPLPTTTPPTPTPTPTRQSIDAQQATSAPAIDGNASDAIWNSTPSSSLTRPIGTPSADFAASYQTAWDSTNLYFLLKVKDASLSGHSDLAEIYLDPKQDQGIGYDSLDMQYQFKSDSTTVVQYSGGVPGTNTAGIVQANLNTSDGYQTEISIPWARLGISPTSGDKLGLDLDLWQNSNSGVKAKLSWNTTEDNAWSNPSVFGSVTLTDTTTGTTSPVDTTSTYHIVNRSSGLLADVNGASGSDGAQIIQWPNNNGNNQKWQFVNAGSGYYNVKNVNSGKIVDVYNASGSDGARIVQWTSNAGNNQQWQIVSAGSGYYKLVNRQSGKVADVSGSSTAQGTSIVQNTDNGSASQQWSFVKL